VSEGVPSTWDFRKRFVASLREPRKSSVDERERRIHSQRYRFCSIRGKYGREKSYSMSGFESDPHQYRGKGLKGERTGGFVEKVRERVIGTESLREDKGNHGESRS